MATFAGFQERSLLSPDLHVTSPVFLFYPTEQPASAQAIGPFVFEGSDRAPILEGQFPLVVLSHGSGGGPLLYRRLAVGLAKAGFIVAAPEHPFNNRIDNSREDSIDNLTERPKTISQVIDLVESDSFFKTRVLRDRVGVVGHSMGGYAALAVAGGIPHTKHQIAYNPNSKVKIPMEIPTRRDDRIRSLILLAPAAGWFISDGALAEVRAPIHIIAAEKDRLTTMRHSEIILKGATYTHVTQTVVKNAGHFSFISPFPEKMRTPKFPPAMDPEGFDRASYQTELIDEVVRVLREHFSKDESVRASDGESKGTRT